jgi:patatin-like phospholipase
MAARSGGIALHLFEALEEEYEALHGPLPPTYARAWEVRAEEILDLDRLVERLRASGDPAGKVVRAGLAREVRERVDAYGSETGDAARRKLRAALAAELNQLLDDRDLTARPGLRGSIPSGVPEEVALLEQVRLGKEDLPKRNRLFLEAVFAGQVARIADVRLAAIYREIDRLPEPRAALCLSGGGLRSAVFSLGVVQGLARAGLLKGFHYLSTVSGGGYLGGFLAAWIHRHRDGIDGVSRDLSVAEEAPEPASARPLEREPRPLRYLRLSSNYLSPSHGLLSADAWTLVATFLRNLYLHWTVSIPLVIAALLVPRLYLAVLEVAKRSSPGVLAWGAIALVGVGSLGFSWAIAYIGWHRPSGRLARGNQRTFFWYCLVPLIVGAVGFTAAWAWAVEVDKDSWRNWLPVTAVATNLLGWFVHVSGQARRGLLRPRKMWELPALVVAGLAGGFLAYGVTIWLFARPLANPALYVCLGPPMPLLIFLAGETLFAGLVSRVTTDEDREWWSRTAGWILIFVAAWVGIAGIAIFAPLVFLALPEIFAPLGGLAGIVSVLLAGSSWTAVRKSAAEGDRRFPEMVEKILAVSIPGFLLFFLAVVSVAIDVLLNGLHNLSPGWLGALPEGRSEWVKALVSFLPEGSDLAKGLSLWHWESFFSDPPLAVPLLFVLALAVSLSVDKLMNINTFSLHAMYRSRLIRAFLGASRERRDPHPFTGFDPADNVEMRQLRKSVFLSAESLGPGEWREAVALLRQGDEEGLASALPPALVRKLRDCDLSQRVPDRLVAGLCRELNRLIAAEKPLSRDFLRGLGVPAELARRARRPPESPEDRQSLAREVVSWALPPLRESARVSKPMPVLNLCLNVAHAGAAVWPLRKKEPFSVTPLHCGSCRAGYRPAQEYGRGATGRAISLGTAMAVSGAAASPDMGYHSSPVVRLLLTLFNARLGWWLGNPGMAGQKTYATAAPRSGVKTLLAEALGLADPGYVYLSDGGHFESLGLYEMVLRRCRRIVVCDVTPDKECTFEHLGRAVRKIRVDLGVRIDFDGLPIYAKGKNDETGRYCAVATIHYPQIDGAPAVEGQLLYLKPAVYGREPRDILHYSNSKKDFPHEPAIDQWFSGSQFESYRMLGLYAVKQICGKGPAPRSLRDLFKKAREHAEPESKRPKAAGRSGRASRRRSAAVPVAAKTEEVRPQPPEDGLQELGLPQQGPEQIL